MLDFDQPWEMLNSLQKWMGALKDTILQFKLPLKTQDKMKEKLETYVKTYEEPEMDENGKLVVKMKSGKASKKDQSSEEHMGGDGANNEGENGEDEDAHDLADLKAQMPLREGVL